MCLNPLLAQLNDIGRIKFTHEGNLKLPCGKCTECISKRSIDWALRSKHEISTHKDNCFITLTYDQDNLPSIFIIKNEFQKFIKKLRKFTKQPLRYIVSHEYGSKTYRPHHHAIIFGYNPNNQIFQKTTNKGEKIFTSKDLTKIWTNGFHSIGQANEKTAYYIASYSLKGKKHTLPDPITGELIEVTDAMDCSKRPAIGYEYFKQNYNQLINSEIPLPRYYLKKLKEINLELFESYENNLQFKFKNRSSHETYAKFILNEQKTNIKSELRETEPNTVNEKNFLDTELLTKRDEYHLLTKGKAK